MDLTTLVNYLFNASLVFPWVILTIIVYELIIDYI